jgi:type II secretory pathway component PulM
MKKNKRPPAGILLCLALGSLFSFRAAFYIREIRGNRESIAQYRKALNDERPLPSDHLSRLEDRAVELRAAETPEEKSLPAPRRNPENPAGMIRGLLNAHGIGVERLRTLSTGGSAGTEFVITGAPVNFLRFLQGTAELPLSLSYISIKTNDHSPHIDVTMRYSHEP